MRDDRLTLGSLFTGIGGFDLGLEQTGGFRTVWFCEQDEFCQRVLAKHWPGIPCYPDIRALRGADIEPVDVLCGGFPCQDLSSAGGHAGLAGGRSGLWFEYLRTICEIRPRYVIVENVPQLRKYLGTILGGLSEAGYDTEWDCIRASDFGAPHQRKRMWLVAYAQGERRRERGGDGPEAPLLESQRLGEKHGSAWTTEPRPVGVAHGVPARAHRLRALGNSLVPQIAQWIGQRILEFEEGVT